MDDAECEESDGSWSGYEAEAEGGAVGFEEDAVVVDVVHLSSFEAWRDAAGVGYTAV